MSPGCECLGGSASGSARLSLRGEGSVASNEENDGDDPAGHAAAEPCRERPHE